MWTKSSLMVGIGETDDEIYETLSDLRNVGVDVVTIGQYLRPTVKHAPVARYVEPAAFTRFADEGRAIGFAYVASGPLVRSSYKAAEAFIRGKLHPGDSASAEASIAQRLSQAAAAASAPLLSPATLVRR